MERAWTRARARPIFTSKSLRGRMPSALPCPQDDSAGVDDVYAVYPDNAAITSVAITGPTNPTGPGDTPAAGKSSFAILLPDRRNLVRQTNSDVARPQCLPAPGP